MTHKYDKEFKMNAVKLYLANDKSIEGIAKDLGISRATLGHGVTSYKREGDRSFPGSGYVIDKELHDLFSITRWIAENKDEDEWLFLTALPSQRETLGPLLASFFNIAFLGLERAGVDFNNRLWMIANELPGLEVPLSGIKRMIAEGAKYGACCVLGFQNKSQIDALYGQSGTKTILSNCSTKIIFRSPDYETARNLAYSIGEQESVITTESYSVGAHQIRDGVNLSSQYRKKFTVTPDEIMALDALQAYILLPGDYPASQTRFKLNQAPDITASFVQKKL